MAILLVTELGKKRVTGCRALWPHMFFNAFEVVVLQLGKADGQTRGAGRLIFDIQVGSSIVIRHVKFQSDSGET